MTDLVIEELAEYRDAATRVLKVLWPSRKVYGTVVLPGALKRHDRELVSAKCRNLSLSLAEKVNEQASEHELFQRIDAAAQALYPPTKAERARKRAQ